MPRHRAVAAIGIGGEGSRQTKGRANCTSQHILLLALQAARSACSTQAYLRTVVENVRLHLSPEGLEKTKNLLEILPSEHKVVVFWYGLVFLSGGLDTF